jgi:hypothetical protein
MQVIGFKGRLPIDREHRFSEEVPNGLKKRHYKVHMETIER